MEYKAGSNLSKFQTLTVPHALFSSLDGPYEVSFTVIFSTCNVEFSAAAYENNTIVFLWANPHKWLLPPGMKYRKQPILQTKGNVLKVIYDDF